jgi:hypothetical protein
MILLEQWRILCIARFVWKPAASDFREEIEKGVDALAQLGLDLLARAFEQMHGYARVVSILEFNGRFADSGHFLGGKQAEAVYQS